MSRNEITLDSVTSRKGIAVMVDLKLHKWWRVLIARQRQTARMSGQSEPDQLSRTTLRENAAIQVQSELISKAY